MVDGGSSISWLLEGKIYLPASEVKAFLAAEDSAAIAGILTGGLTIKAPWPMALPAWIVASSISLNLMRLRWCSDGGQHGVVLDYGLLQVPLPTDVLWLCSSQG
jgi:hypothetical protein